MKVPAIRINWGRVLPVIVAAIAGQDDHRPGHEKLAGATAVVCRELGIQAPSDRVIEFVESVVQGVFDQRKAGGGGQQAEDRAKALVEEFATHAIAHLESRGVAKPENCANLIETLGRMVDAMDVPGAANNRIAEAEKRLAEVAAERDALAARVKELEAAAEKKSKRSKGAKSDDAEPEPGAEKAS